MPTLDGNGNFSPSESLQNGILNDDRRSSQGPPMQFSDSPHQSIEPARNNVTLAPQNGVPLRPILSLDKPSSPRLHPQNYRRRLTTIDGKFRILLFDISPIDESNQNLSHTLGHRLSLEAGGDVKPGLGLRPRMIYRRLTSPSTMD